MPFLSYNSSYGLVFNKYGESPFTLSSFLLSLGASKFSQSQLFGVHIHTHYYWMGEVREYYFVLPIEWHNLQPISHPCWLCSFKTERVSNKLREVKISLLLTLRRTKLERMCYFVMFESADWNLLHGC